MEPSDTQGEAAVQVDWFTVVDAVPVLCCTEYTAAVAVPAPCGHRANTS
jgi:hypothetical protein